MDRHALVTPERLYLTALGLSGCAALISIALPAHERGELAASIASATLGAAVGGLSVDTFLLSRPRGWFAARGHRWVAALVAACLALAAMVSLALTAAAGVGSYLLGAAAASTLTLLNVFAALTMRRDDFLLAYATRAAGAAALVCGYLVLYTRGEVTGEQWSTVWLAAQAVTAVGLGGVVLLRWRRTPPARPDGRAGPGTDLRALGVMHIGAGAQMITYRFDQILLARFAGSGALGVYSLAVSALEFAQAGAVVRAQRILAGRDPAAPDGAGARAVLAGALPLALAAVAGLAILGLVRPPYADAWLLGLLLVPGTLAVAVGKVASATLLKRQGELATTVVALTTMVAAVALYLVLVPVAGAVGAAVAASLAYGVYAVRTRQSLRRAVPALPARAA